VIRPSAPRGYSRPVLPPRPTTPTRRTAVRLLAGAVVGGVFLSGCDLADLSGATPSGGAGDRDGGAADPDTAVVDRTVADVRSRLVEVARARQLYPQLRVPLAPLEDMHRAHLAVLAQGDPVATPSAPAPSAPTPPGTARGPAAARRTARRVRTAHLAHQQALVAAAVAVQSGALARLLASMSASTGQHLVALSDLPGGSS